VYFDFVFMVYFKCCPNIFVIFLGEMDFVKLLEKNIYIYMRNDPYTHFLQQPHNKLTWLVIFYYFFVLFCFLFILVENRLDGEMKLLWSCCKK